MTWWMMASAFALPPGATWGVTGHQANVYLGLCTAVLDADGDGYDDVAVSAHSFAHPETSEGGVAVFYGNALGLPSTPDWTMEGDQVDANAGSCLASAGDVNADGYDDLLVGLSGASHGQTGEGAAVLYLGGPAGLGALPSWAAESDVRYAGFGRGLAGVGDVDGDGYDDVVVGAPWLDGALYGSGRVSLYRGGPAGLRLAPSWTMEADQTYSGFGFAVDGADLDGDGYSDVIVGAYTYGPMDGGAAFAYRGGPQGPSAAPDWRVVDPRGGDEFGIAVKAIGDVNGDGHEDVAVGADRKSDGQNREGTVSVFLGSATGPAPVASWFVGGDQANAQFGWSLAGADLDGDGFTELLVGASQGGQAAEGTVSVYLGSAAGLGATPAVRLESNQADASFGASILAGADTDGDGLPEVLVGANTWDATASSEGGLFLYEP